MKEFTLFGPSEKHSVIKGGFCISVFAVISRDNCYLLVRPASHSNWKEEWAPNWRMYSEDGIRNELESWRFPSSYIMEGEHPDSTLARILNDQLRLEKYSVGAASLLNFYEPSRRYPGHHHWDYCFIYRVQTEEMPPASPWFSETRYIPADEMDTVAFGSAQGAIAATLQTA